MMKTDHHLGYKGECVHRCRRRKILNYSGSKAISPHPVVNDPDFPVVTVPGKRKS